jgi:TolA-binding protein
MVIMHGMNRSWRICLLVAVLGIAAAGWAQDAPETPPTPAQADTPAISPVPDDSGLASQVEQLRSEVDQLKQQIAYLNSVVTQLQGPRTPVEQSSAKRPAGSKSSTALKKKTQASGAPAPIPSIIPEGEDRAPMTVLVFHDGHKTEARNYAIVGQTLWIYTEQDSKKVPLADLDVAATKDANSDRGITFQVPPTK